MNKYLRLLNKIVLFTTPILASSVLLSSPSKAATFAGSNGSLLFTEFSQSPSNVANQTNTETLAIGEGGMVKAIAQADAIFLIEPATASNSSLSIAFGENRDYLGIAESQASVIGKFDIEANTDFSFNFLADFNLATSIDNPPQENARASGDISFALIDTQSNDVLEFFSLAGNITTEGDNDFVGFQKSNNVILNETDNEASFGGLEEFLTVSVEGTLERYFTNETTLALIEMKQNRVQVTASEPSSNLALFLASGVIAIIVNRRRK